jgi:type I restriction enzyme M protein
MLQVQIKDGKIYAPLKNKWLVKTPEEEVRQQFICHLVNNYGYSLDQMDQEITLTNSKRGTARARADIVIWRSKEEKLNNTNAFIVIECKSDNVKIIPGDYQQGNNYASWARSKFFVTHNNKETKFFQMLEDKLPVDLNEIIDIPNAKDVFNDKEIKNLLAQTKTFSRDEFSRLLFKCHNIIRNNDKLSPEGAFDEISKILFMKIRYERLKEKERVIFSLDRFKHLKESYNETKTNNSIPYFQYLFEQTKEEFKNDELFDENETIKIRENSFEQIVKELEKYNLSDTSDDVKGIAFEQFLGKTFRGELGQFFTPRSIVDFMVDVLDPKEGDVICDPCSGSGGFLIKAFEYVKEKIEKDVQRGKKLIWDKYFDENYEKLDELEQIKINEKVEVEFAKLNEQLNNRKTGTRLWNLSHNCIYGTDANPRMARTSKMNMIMHGDGHGGVHHNDGLLNINGIFEGRFNIILTNPPFGARVDKNHKITLEDKYKDKTKIEYYLKKYGSQYQTALNQIENNIGKNIIDLYDLGEFSTLTEVLFMERNLKLLKPSGRMAVVLPEGFLNNPNLVKIREYFEGRAKILLIVSIPQDVFIASGATVKPSLVFLQKFSETELENYESILEVTKKETEAKYSLKIQELETKSKDRKLDKDEKKNIKNEIKQLQNQLELETKALVKDKFNYQIPIVEVQKAGISATGEIIENELVEVVKEWREYQKNEKA